MYKAREILREQATIGFSFLSSGFGFTSIGRENGEKIF